MKIIGATTGAYQFFVQIELQFQWKNCEFNVFSENKATVPFATPSNTYCFVSRLKGTHCVFTLLTESKMASHFRVVRTLGANHFSFLLGSFHVE